MKDFLVLPKKIFTELSEIWVEDPESGKNPPGSRIAT
jgi:hypothetical protein